MRKVVALMAMFLFAAGSAQAQVIWDSPFLVPPKVESGYGLYAIQPGSGKIGALGSLRPIAGNPSLGVRVGVAENDKKKFTVFGGVDMTGSVLRVDKDTPVDLDWIAGVGAGAGRPGVILSVPVGFTVGRTFTYQQNRFTPYLIPRVAADIVLGNRDDVPSLDHRAQLKLAVDLGFDAQWRDSWLIRFGYTFRDYRKAVAIGVVFKR